MNTQQLRDKLYSIEKIGYGTYRVTLQHCRRVKRANWAYGWKYSYRYTTHITHNQPAIDRMKDHGYIPDRSTSHFYTYRQALLALVKNK